MFFANDYLKTNPSLKPASKLQQSSKEKDRLLIKCTQFRKKKPGSVHVSLQHERRINRETEKEKLKLKIKTRVEACNVVYINRAHVASTFSSVQTE